MALRAADTNARRRAAAVRIQTLSRGHCARNIVLILKGRRTQQLHLSLVAYYAAMIRRVGRGYCCRLQQQKMFRTLQQVHKTHHPPVVSNQQYVAEEEKHATKTVFQFFSNSDW